MNEYYNQTSTNKDLKNNSKKIPTNALTFVMVLGSISSIGAINVSSRFVDTGTGIPVHSIIKAVSAVTIESIRFNMEVTEPKVYDNDPEILALTDAQIKAEALAMNGAWVDRDDINDEWLDNLRSGWNERLDEVYGPNNESISS